MTRKKIARYCSLPTETYENKLLLQFEDKRVEEKNETRLIGPIFFPNEVIMVI